MSIMSAHSSCLFILLFVCISFQSLLGDDHTQVSYFSFISGVRNTSEAQSNIVIYNQIEQSDDSPFVRVNLPWRFNLLGENVNSLFVNPNGGLHASIVQPCPEYNYFGTDLCDLTNSYYDVIGGMLTDLNPHTSISGKVYSYVSADHLVVSFTNIVYFGTQLSNSFRIMLFKDGHIEIAYDKISKTSQFPQTNMWASGLRSSPNHTFVDFTSQQLTFVRSEWGSSSNVPGIYPKKADVATGNQFNICPISQSWCVSPSTISRNESMNANPIAYITLTTTLLGCSSTVQYGMVFSRNDSSSVSQSWSVACEVVQNVSLQCSIADILAQDMSAGAYQLVPAWRLTDLTTFTALPVNSLVVSIVNVSFYNTTSHAYPVLGCANTHGNCGTDSCALCQGNTSCLRTPCEQETAQSTVAVGLSSAVYNRVTCNDTCPIFTNNDSSEVFYTDYQGTCCPLSQMDCSGLCGGTSLVAVMKVGRAVVCCSPPFKVDCMGVCDGNSTRDFCGTCNGDDAFGINCFDPTDINVTTSSTSNVLYPVYSLVEVGGLVQVLQVNISNTSPFQISAYFTEPTGTSTMSPILTLPPATTLVPANRWKVFNVPTSMVTLVLGNATQWASKSFLVQYRRTVDPTPVFTTTVRVLPAMAGCHNLTTPDRCARLPGCIYCFTSNNWRILRSAADDEGGGGGNRSFFYPNGSRRLFIELLPGIVSDPGMDLEGICGDGWLTGDCYAASPSGFLSAASRSSSQVLSVGSAVIFIVILSLFFSN